MRSICRLLICVHYLMFLQLGQLDFFDVLMLTIFLVSCLYFELGMICFWWPSWIHWPLFLGTQTMQRRGNTLDNKTKFFETKFGKNSLFEAFYLIVHSWHYPFLNFTFTCLQITVDLGSHVRHLMVRTALLRMGVPPKKTGYQRAIWRCVKRIRAEVGQQSETISGEQMWCYFQ